MNLEEMFPLGILPWFLFCRVEQDWQKNDEGWKWPPIPRTISEADFHDQDQNLIVDTSDWVHFNPNDHLFLSHLHIWIKSIHFTWNLQVFNEWLEACVRFIWRNRFKCFGHCSGDLFVYSCPILSSPRYSSPCRNTTIMYHWIFLFLSVWWFCSGQWICEYLSPSFSSLDPLFTLGPAHLFLLRCASIYLQRALYPSSTRSSHLLHLSLTKGQIPQWWKSWRRWINNC